MPFPLVTAPAEEPVSLFEAKHHLREDEDDQDALIELYTQAAREHCEQETGRLFVTQTREVVLDSFPCGPIEILTGPVQSIESVTYVDEDGAEQTLAAEAWMFAPNPEPARVAPVLDWPRTQAGRPGAVTVRFVGGYGNAINVPAPLKAAILLVLGDSYENREATVLGERVEIVEVPAARNLMRNYVFGRGAA